MSEQRSRVSAAAMTAALLMAGGSGRLLHSHEKAEPEERPCLNCGKPKRHNNSFCSANCCKEYKAKSHQPNGD